MISSKKFRVVFDGSCKTDSGISLNEAQFVGPKIQKDLYEIIMRFRRHKIALTTDIKKMYRQIKIIPEQYNLQRIFWREHPSMPLKEYCLVVVTYGLSSSPYLSVRAMIQGAVESKEQFPEAARAIKEDFYMDDGTTGTETERDAIQLAKDMKHVLGKYGFELCKWRSNSQKLVQELEGENDTDVLFTEKDVTSVLGLKWIPKSDEFTCVVNIQKMTTLTKRSIMSKIGQLFDR